MARNKTEEKSLVDMAPKGRILREIADCDLVHGEFDHRGEGRKDTLLW